MATSYSYYIDTESRTLRKADEEHGRLEKADAPRFNFGETPHFSLSFPEGTFGAGDVIVVAIDTDKNLLGTAPMSMVEHLVTSDEAAAQTIELDMPTRTQRFIDAMDNRPFEVRVFFEVSRHYETVNDDGEGAGENGTTQMDDLLCDDYAYAKASVAQYGDPLVVLPSQYYYKKDELNAIADGMEQIKEDAEGARDTAIEAKEGAEENATLARSYARGDTGSREDEGTDNALYYKGQAETAKTDAETAKAGAIDAKNAASTSSDNAKAWAEGSDAQVQALGGEHSAKGWAEHIDANYVPLSQKGAANGVAQLDSSGKVPTTQLPDISGGKIDAITVNGTEVPVTSKTANITIDSDDVGALPADSTGALLGLSIDPQTYVMTLQLKNSSGTVLDTKAVDLPLETMVVSASYDDGTLTLTLQNGQTLDVDISAIVSGLIPSSEKGANNGVASLDSTGKVPDAQLSSNAINAIDAITFNGSAVPVSNKTANITATIPTALSQLSQDSDHRTVTDAEKTAWNNKSDFSGSYNDLTDKPSLDYIPQTAKGAANGVASLDSTGKVPNSELPSMDYIPNSQKGAANGVAPLDGNSLVPDENLPALAPLPLHLNAAPTTSTVGVFGQHAIVDSTGKEYTCVAVTTQDDVTTYTWVDDINAKGGTFKGRIVYNYGYFNAGCGGEGKDISTFYVRQSNNKLFEVDYLEHGVYAQYGYAQGITVIPAATTSYTLAEGCFSHAPAEASTYTFPAVTDTTRTHQIRLTLDFTTVQTYAFVDAQGNAIAPLFTPTITAGDVYEFRCEYSAIQSKWLIYPCKQGAVSDDYVMQAEVGAANGVAGLDANGKVPEGELPKGTTSVYGCVKLGSTRGLGIIGGYTTLQIAPDILIDSRATIGSTTSWGVIAPDNLNYAVTAALTDANHITLTSEQQATAQSVIGVPAPLILNTAPTTSTVGVLGQLAVDTTTSKTYHCTAITNTGTEAEPVWSYTWTDDVNSKGGTFVEPIRVGTAGTYSVFINKNNISIGEGSTLQLADLAVANSGYSNVQYSIICGIQSKTGYDNLSGGGVIIGGSHNIADNVRMCIGKGTNLIPDNALELSINGDLDIAGGFQQDVTEIPSATTLYNLAEGVQTHIPTTASVYVLPTVPLFTICSDKHRYYRNLSKDGTGYYGWSQSMSYRYTNTPNPTTSDFTWTNTALTSGKQAITAIDNRTHECILDVKFDNVQTLVFQGANGNVIEPQDDIDIQQGDVWRFLCQWNTLLKCWCIMPVPLQNKTILPPVLSISPSSYSVEGNQGTALEELDLSENVTVQHPATGASLSFSSSDLPTGVSISSAGVISGTPTTQGTTTSTITIAYPNATSITCTVTFTIAAPAVTYYYTVSGATATPAANGDYYVHSGTHGSSGVVYTNGTHYMFDASDCWVINNAPEWDPEGLGPLFGSILHSAEGSYATVPTGTWTNGADMPTDEATVSAYGA